MHLSFEVTSFRISVAVLVFSGWPNRIAHKRSTKLYCISAMLQGTSDEICSRIVIIIWPLCVKVPDKIAHRCLVTGHPGSRVVGAITDGIFQGRIVLSDSHKYHVERKEHYRDNADLSSNDMAHSIVYHDDSVDLDKFYK